MPPSTRDAIPVFGDSHDVAAPTGALTASVGFGVFQESTSSDDILSRADDAMYADKGRDRAPVRRLRSVE